MRSRDHANRPPRADDRFARKQQPAATDPRVANQQPDALQEQQRGVWGQPCAVLLAHHPGYSAGSVLGRCGGELVAVQLGEVVGCHQ